MSGRTDGGFVVREADWSAQSDREGLRTVRYQVFVVEQQVPESLEWDDVDPHCRHALALERGGRPIGAGRLLPDGHIGRMAVLDPWRGAGVGGSLLRFLVELARSLGHREARLNAQVHAVPFYRRHGFVEEGEEFDEAGIPHRAMRRVLGGDST